MTANPTEARSRSMQGPWTNRDAAGQTRGRSGPGTPPRTPVCRPACPRARARGRLPSRAGCGALLPAAGSRACCRAPGWPRRARAGRRLHWRAAPALQPRGTPAAQGTSSHQQRRQTGWCSSTVPFTELSRLIGKGTITGISPDSTTIHTPPRKGGLFKKKKKKAGLSYSFFFPLFPQTGIQSKEQSLIFCLPTWQT